MRVVPLHPPKHELPIFPLSDEVHFPRTELEVEVVEPEYCQLAEDLYRSGGQHRLGVVLLRPPGELDLEDDTVAEDSPRPPVFHAGTAARIVGWRATEQGCDIVLRGEYRFELERESGAGPSRRAWVIPLREARISEIDPDVQDMRRELLERVTELSHELGDRFALTDEQVDQLRHELPFEVMVNHLAAHLDMAAEHKLQLLESSLPDRALHLLTVLRSRRRILDLLRPFRRLADGARIN